MASGYNLVRNEIVIEYEKIQVWFRIRLYQIEHRLRVTDIVCVAPNNSRLASSFIDMYNPRRHQRPIGHTLFMVVVRRIFSHTKSEIVILYKSVNRETCYRLAGEEWLASTQYISVLECDALRLRCILPNNWRGIFGELIRKFPPKKSSPSRLRRFTDNFAESLTLYLMFLVTMTTIIYAKDNDFLSKWRHNNVDWNER